MSMAEVGLELETAKAESSALAAGQNLAPSGLLGFHT